MKISQEKYDSYIAHALEMNRFEASIRDELMPEVPDRVIDCHTHLAVEGSCDIDEIPEHIQRHMMSTFTGFTIDQSKALDSMFFPDKDVSKARFSHVFPNIDKVAVNEAAKNSKANGDYPFLFGISNSDDDIEYTISELMSGNYRGLKMYYLASDPPKYGLYEYFPKPILEVAQKQGIPIVLHLPHSLYNSADEVVELANNFPDLKIILAHIGVANIPKPEIDRILNTFAELPNVYADTALVDCAEVVLKALQHLGHRRVMYGSDEPLNLLRTVTYFNPELQSARVLTDFPYHWANPEEQQKYGHLTERPFVHNHWLQLQALIGSIALTSDSPADRQHKTELIFSENAKELFAS